MTQIGSRRPNVLSIAGSDPSGAAGVQADLKTFAAFGVYGAAAITAITVQNTYEVRGVWTLAATTVAQQLDAILSDIDFDAVKIGMLGDAANVAQVARALRARRVKHVVLDPVLASSSGTQLLNDAGIDVLRRELLPLAHVVTPNIVEAGVLLERAPASIRSEMHDAANDLCALGPQWTLVTGGHLHIGTECVDVLAGSDGHTQEIRTTRVAGPDRRGTGCTLSSAIASLLALGRDVPAACEEAQAYVASAMVAASALGVGHGNGPLNHVPFPTVLAAHHV